MGRAAAGGDQLGDAHAGAGSAASQLDEPPGPPGDGQLEEPYWMGTFVVWVCSHWPAPSTEPEARSRHAVSTLPSAASASTPPPAGSARVTARPRGSRGSACHAAPAPATYSARLPLSSTTAAP